MDEPSGHPSMSTGLSSTSTMNITPKVEKNAWEISSRFTANGPSDTSLFSSSLPVLTHEKLNFIDLENRPIEDASAELHKLTKDADDTESVGILLPDEEELFAGIADDFDFSGLPDQVVEGEEYDLFGSGGGMELDFDPTENLAASMSKTNINDGYLGNGCVQHSIPNGVGAVAGEHPYGEHPSRTLFVRNINSNVDDSELRSLFEQYGDIRTLYTACKHRGFVMISYFDIRAARSAMRALQNRAVRRRKLDIHFSIPKENPSDKDINQGTLVIFNLDPSVTNEDLRRIFGIYGEVKEIRETPHKRHHKFIEFYDVRAAEAALRGLNRIEIAGKRIKLEHSRPGGARRNLIQQLNQDLDHDETRSYIHQVGSPVPNSPPGFWAFNSPSDNSPLRPLSQSPTSGLGSMLPPLLSNSVKISPIGKEQSLRIPFQQSHSFPEHSGIMPTYMTSNSANLNSVGPPTSGASLGTLTGAQFLWGSSTTCSDRNQTSVCQKLPIGHSFTTNVQGRGFPYSIRQGSTSIPSSYHHVGSAPSGVPFDRHFGFGHFPESPESSFMSQLPFGGSGMSCNEGNLLMSMGSHGRSIIPGMPPRLGHILPGSSPYSGSGSVGTEGFFQHGKSRRVENSGSQIESQQQYQLDLEKIVSGEDTRTTLMIKNIPNKYTSKMLLAAIDEIHKGTYDFFYLPIDFKNKCNVGYAFINMVSPSHIVPFYQAFNGKKWEKFNSEKVALLAYARIQGKSALVAHFQNSSLMNEDRRCRPILFHSEEEEAIVQELFSSNGLNYYVRHSDSSLALDSLESSTSNNPRSGR